MTNITPERLIELANETDKFFADTTLGAVLEGYAAALRAAADALAAREALLAKVGEALRPFAIEADEWAGVGDDDGELRLLTQSSGF